MPGRSTAGVRRKTAASSSTFTSTGAAAKGKKKVHRGVSRSRSRSVSRGSRTAATRKTGSTTQRPSWDDSTSDLSAYRLSKSELLRKKISLRSKHNVIYIPEEALREAKRKSDLRKQQQQAAAAQKKKHKVQNLALEDASVAGVRDGKRDFKARNPAAPASRHNPNAHDSLNSSFEEEKLLQGAQSFNQVLLRHGVLGGAQGNDGNFSLDVVDLDDEITQFEHRQLLEMQRNSDAKANAHTGMASRSKKRYQQKQKQLNSSSDTMPKEPASAAVAPVAELHSPHMQRDGDLTNRRGHDSRASQHQYGEQGHGSASGENGISDGASSLDLILDDEAASPLKEFKDEIENHTAQLEVVPQRTHADDSCSDGYDPQVEMEMLEEEVASSTNGSMGGGHKFQQTLALCKFLYAEMGTQRQQLKACQADNRVLQDQLSQLQESHRTLQREMEFLKLRHNLQGIQSQVSDSTSATTFDTITSKKQRAVLSQNSPGVQKHARLTERAADAADTSALSKVRFAHSHEQKSQSHGRISDTVDPSYNAKEHSIPEIQVTKEPRSQEIVTDDARGRFGLPARLADSPSVAPTTNERVKEVLGPLDKSSPATENSDAEEDDLAPLTIHGEEEVVDLSADAELDFDITRPLEGQHFLKKISSMHNDTVAVSSSRSANHIVSTLALFQTRSRQANPSAAGPERISAH